MKNPCHKSSQKFFKFVLHFGLVWLDLEISTLGRIKMQEIESKKIQWEKSPEEQEEKNYID